ncbi:hypothetical protein Tco_0502323 [Tanacetum coccineum]
MYDRLGDIDSNIFKLSDEVENFTTVVSRMSEQYDQFYGEFDYVVRAVEVQCQTMVSLLVSKADRLECAYTIYPILTVIPNKSRIIWEVEFFKGWKPLSPLQLAVEEVMKNTSIGARDAGFGRGKRAKEETQGQLRRNLPAGVTP